MTKTFCTEAFAGRLTADRTYSGNGYIKICLAEVDKGRKVRILADAFKKNDKYGLALSLKNIFVDRIDPFAKACIYGFALEN